MLLFDGVRGRNYLVVNATDERRCYGARASGRTPWGERHRASPIHRRRVAGDRLALQLVSLPSVCSTFQQPVLSH